MVARRRRDNVCYELEATNPTSNEIKKFFDINNLEELSAIINVNFFNGFPVVSRAMVNNWIHYPDRPRRQFGDYFKIAKVRV